MIMIPIWISGIMTIFPMIQSDARQELLLTLQSPIILCFHANPLVNAENSTKAPNGLAHRRRGRCPVGPVLGGFFIARKSHYSSRVLLRRYSPEIMLIP
jgi:hypothetical protein